MRLLLVEDDDKLSAFLARVFREEDYLVETRTSGREGIAAAADADVVVLDWMLPDIDGLEVCRELRAKGNDVPVLMLTARGEVDDRVRGLKTGADDYLVKPFEVNELLARLEALLRRGAGPALAVGSLRLDWQRRRAWFGEVPVNLTGREFEVLAHLAKNAGKVVTKGELLSAVWGAGFDPGTNIVEVHLSRLRTKLGASPGLIETVRGGGYRLRAGSST